MCRFFQHAAIRGTTDLQRVHQAVDQAHAVAAAAVIEERRTREVDVRPLDVEVVDVHPDPQTRRRRRSVGAIRDGEGLLAVLLGTLLRMSATLLLYSKVCSSGLNRIGMQ